MRRLRKDRLPVRLPLSTHAQQSKEKTARTDIRGARKRPLFGLCLAAWVRIESIVAASCVVSILFVFRRADGLAQITPLKNLISLSIARTGNGITDEALLHVAGLVKLEKLDLDCAHISKAGLVHLKPLHNLRELDLSGTDVTSDVAKSVVPNCKIVRLY